jgi:hypothetical protein
MNMGSSFARWLHEQKDASVSFILQKAVKTRLEKFGRVLELRIDSRQNILFLELLLKGENEPVSVSLEDYKITQEGDQTWITINKGKSSREWINAVIEEFVLHKAFLIPAPYAGWAKMIL